MAIIYDPAKIIRKIAPAKKIKKLISSRAGLKKTALSFVDDSEVVSKKSIERVALKTIKSYKKRIKEDPSIKEDLVNDPALLKIGRAHV